MAETDNQDADLDDARRVHRRRFAYFLIALLAVLLLAFIPPLINVSRLQRRVDTEISAALGRPVHFDHLSLNLLPMPGFTLENLVVEEDPAFGYEPTLHADEVRIDLRLSSLWRRRIEIATVSFTDPSVNLVHTSDGRWNIESLLLQASHISAAPTAQRHAGSAPRFPYIEATGARVNLKLNQEKTPVSLTDADFALWQPAEHQWRLRIEAHPVRTDIAPGASGTLRVEGTLGGDGEQSTLASMPINLQSTWQDAQLGGLTSLLLGRDAGLRGNLASNISILGTIGRNTIVARLTIENARRADFIPPHAISVSVGCRASAESSFHAFPSIACRLPPASSSSPAMLALAASVPDVRHPELSSLRLDVPGLPSQALLDWLDVATPHPPTAFAGRGTFTGALEWSAHATPAVGSGGPVRNKAETTVSRSAWTGELRLSGEWLRLSALGPDGAPLGDVILRSSSPVTPPARSQRMTAAQSIATPAPDSFDLLPVSLPLGGTHAATLSGHVDDSGYSLHLAGPVVLDQLFALGDAIPQFGDGLRKLLAPPGSASQEPASSTSGADDARDGAKTFATQPPVSVDLDVSRAWGGMQVWSQAAPTAAPPRRRIGSSR